MMRKAQKLAAGIASVMMLTVISAPVSFAADKAFGIDEINWTAQDWNSIAMTNDDTVETGAVIRTQADMDSKAAGYLYRGAAVRIVEKGDEWSEVRSGKVTGYVKNEFLAFGDDARGLAAHYGTQGIVANWNDVNVFSKNDAQSQITAQLKDGTPMSMVEDNGHWITVQHGADSAGFVSEEDVTRVLLVDTAVPAEGDDLADVPATMTAADVAAASADQGYSASDTESGEGDGAACSGDTGSYTEDTTVFSAAEDGYGEGNYEDTGDGSYVEDPSAYSNGDSWGQDSSWSQDASGETTDTSWETPDTSYEAPAQTSETYATQTVSSNAEIQALYDAYISAQNAAMDCTSEEDARTKADAAIRAWNAYLAACGEAPVSTSSTDSGSASAETVYTDDTQSQSYSTETTQNEASYAESTQEQSASAGPDTSASSGQNAYGCSDLDLLAAIIWCEAGNQTYDGMVAVGQVVMNRVASPNFPNTIAEVLNQPGQFTPASAGTLQAAVAAGVNANCYSAAQDAMNGAAPVPGYPLYFNTHSGSYQLGAHYFS